LGEFGNRKEGVGTFLFRHGSFFSSSSLSFSLLVSLVRIQQIQKLIPFPHHFFAPCIESNVNIMSHVLTPIPLRFDNQTQNPNTSFEMACSKAAPSASMKATTYREWCILHPDWEHALSCDATECAEDLLGYEDVTYDDDWCQFALKRAVLDGGHKVVKWVIETFKPIIKSHILLIAVGTKNENVLRGGPPGGPIILHPQRAAHVWDVQHLFCYIMGLNRLRVAEHMFMNMNIRRGGLCLFTWSRTYDLLCEIQQKRINVFITLLVLLQNNELYPPADDDDAVGDAVTAGCKFLVDIDQAIESALGPVLPSVSTRTIVEYAQSSVDALESISKHILH
jgi:hypothetical protein